MSAERHLMAVAAHLVLRDDQHGVLLLRRSNTGYADGCWGLPAGHVEAGETAAEACAREAAEEVGIDIDPDDLRFLLVQHKHDFDGQERIDLFFEAHLPPGQQPIIAEPHKCDQLTWQPIDEPPTPIVPDISAVLRSIATANHAGLTYFGFAPPACGSPRQRAQRPSPGPEDSAT